MHVTPEFAENKRLQADTLTDVIGELEWAQDLIPSPSIDSALASIRLVRDQLVGEAKLIEQLLRGLGEAIRAQPTKEV